MKIALVSSSYPPTISGVSTVVHQLAIKLSQNNHQVIVITSNTSPKTTILKQKQLHVYKLPAIPNPFRFNHHLPLPTTRKIANILQEFSPHIIHLHDPSPLSLSSLTFAHKHQIPIIITHHFTSELVLQSFKLTQHLNSNQSLIKLLAPIYNKAQAIIVPSKTVMNQIKSFFNPPLIHIPNGINTNHFKPQSQSIIKTDFLYVGRLDPEKNLPLLINTFQSVSTQLPIKLTLVGSGTQQSYLQQLSSQNIFFKKPQPHQKLPQIYNSAKIFITTSNSENHPLSLIEALSCGLPVIAPNSAGIPDLIKHQYNGLLTKPNDPISLAIAITLLHTNTNLYNQLSFNARKSALQFDLSNFLNNHLQLYHQLQLNRSK